MIDKLRICYVLFKNNPAKFKHYITCNCPHHICKLDFKYIDTKTNTVKFINLSPKT